MCIKSEVTQKRTTFRKIWVQIQSQKQCKTLKSPFLIKHQNKQSILFMISTTTHKHFLIWLPDKQDHVSPLHHPKLTNHCWKINQDVTRVLCCLSQPGDSSGCTQYHPAVGKNAAELSPRCSDEVLLQSSKTQIPEAENNDWNSYPMAGSHPQPTSNEWDLKRVCTLEIWISLKNMEP